MAERKDLLSAAAAVRGAADGYRDRLELVGSGFPAVTVPAGGPVPRVAPTRVVRTPTPALPRIVERVERSVSMAGASPTPVESEEAGGPGGLPRGARVMLATVVRVAPRALTGTQWALLCGMKAGSRTFKTYKSTLRTRGLITVDGDLVSPTAEGMLAAGDVAPLNQDQLIDMWSRSLALGARRMFLALVDAYPHSLSRDELTVIVGSDSERTFKTYLSTLNTNQLIVTDGPDVRLSEDLMV